MRNGKAVVLSGAIGAATALYFWTQSRIPALGEKAMMGERSAVASLSFGELLRVEDAMPLWERIAFTAVNWGNTNWRGMTFGLLFAAAFLTFLGFVLPGGARRRGHTNVWLNTLKGVVVGAPLGLCANCATPVGRGMHAAGLRSETALAALFSSPTLNPIVLTMLFTLFPLYVAGTKLALTLLFILVVVPLLARALLADRDGARAPEAGGVEALERSVFSPSSFAARLMKTPELLAADPGAGTTTTGAGTGAATAAGTWAGALRATAVSLVGNLLFILKVTVPLMVLAGVLGAAAVQLLPLQRFFDVPVSTLSLLGAAVLGAFLPVPMAFDVLAVAIFTSAGLPVPIGVTLLFTLGLFSVYPFLVIWRDMSRAAALALYAAVVVLGAGAGHLVWLYESSADAGLRRVLDEKVGRAPDPTADMRKLARQRCATLTPAERASHCVNAFVLQRVVAGDSAALCEELRDRVAEYAECQRQVRFEAALRASVVAGTTRPCEQLDAGEHDACRTAAIESIALNDLSRMLQLCGEFGVPDRVRRCRREGLNGWVKNRGDATLCEYLDNSGDAAACVRFATISRAVLEERPEACQALPPEQQDFCMRGVVERLMKRAMPSDDPSSCAALAPFGLVDPCTAQWIEMRVRISGDAAWCDRLPAMAQQARPDCLESALLRKLDREIAAARIAALTPQPLRVVGGPVQPVPRSAPPPVAEVVLDSPELKITSTPHAARASATARSTRFEGAELGITHPFEMRALDVKEPFAYGRGIASGDVDGDGRPDLVLASRGGFELYLRRGDRFAAAPIAVPEVAGADAFVVALVDLDNDGWLDLFLTAYGGDDFVVWNDHHAFAAPRVTRVSSGGAVLTMSAAFGDLDGDGRLDMVLGNWSFGAEKGFVPARSKNLVLLNRGDRFESVPLDEVAGETLSVLLTDLDGDGKLDLLVGNDHDRPDQYYLGEGGGHFRRIGPGGPIPVTPMHTMSIDSADLDNDGKLDVFATDMSFADSEARDYCAPITDAADRDRCARGLTLDPIVRNRDVEACKHLDASASFEAPGAARAECTVMMMVELALHSRDESLCARIPTAYPSHRALCENLIGRSSALPFRMSDHLPQKAHNVLLMAGPGGRFVDRAQELGAASSFWSWNARAFDVDNDGWQDLYVGNGFRFAVKHPNVLFHNEGGKRFARRESEFGLADLLDTPSFTSVDFDGDGDLDIVATAHNGPVRVYRNEESTHHAVEIELRDERGNRFGVGAKVIVRSASGTRMREIKAGGGFLSCDAPVAHFGLGSDERITFVEVRWPTGQSSVIERELKANSTYVITRRSK